MELCVERWVVVLALNYKHVAEANTIACWAFKRVVSWRKEGEPARREAKATRAQNCNNVSVIEPRKNSYELCSSLLDVKYCS